MMAVMCIFPLNSSSMRLKLHEKAAPQERPVIQILLLIAGKEHRGS